MGVEGITLPTPASFKVVFDLTFFFTYFIGWTLTAIYQREFMWNNNVARVFKVFNICVGVDSFPSQPIAAITGTLSFTILGGVMLAYAEKIALTATHGFVVVRRSLLVFSWIMMITFMLTYAVPPNTYTMTMIHVGAFDTGCWGYLLLQIMTILEYTKFADNPVSCKDRRGLLWLSAQIMMAVMLFVMGTGLTFELLTVDIKSLVATVDNGVIPAKVVGGLDIKKSDVHPDYKGDALVVTTLIGPIIAAFNQPEPFWRTPFDRNRSKVPTEGYE